MAEKKSKKKSPKKENKITKTLKKITKKKSSPATAKLLRLTREEKKMLKLIYKRANIGASSAAWSTKTPKTDPVAADYTLIVNSESPTENNTVTIENIQKKLLTDVDGNNKSLTDLNDLSVTGAIKEALSTVTQNGLSIISTTNKVVINQGGSSAVALIDSGAFADGSELTVIIGTLTGAFAIEVDGTPNAPNDLFPIELAGGVDWTDPEEGDTITFVFYNQVWYEKSRSVNHT